MGISTDAILFYGVSFEEVDLGSDDLDMETFYLKNLGIERKDDEDYNLWNKRKDEALDGIIFGQHCSYDYPIYYIATKEFSASRGYEVDINLDSLVIDPQWNEKIEKVCKVLGLEQKKSDWKLASFLG